MTVIDPNILAETIRLRIWPDQDGYHSVPAGAEPCSQEEARRTFVEVGLNFFETDELRGFSFKIDDIVINLAFFDDDWTGETMAVMRFHQEDDAAEVILVTNDCHRSHWWNILDEYRMKNPMRFFVQDRDF